MAASYKAYRITAWPENKPTMERAMPRGQNAHFRFRTHATNLKQPLLNEATCITPVSTCLARRPISKNYLDLQKNQTEAFSEGRRHGPT